MDARSVPGVKRFRFIDALPVLLMLTTWVVCGWVAYCVQFGDMLPQDDRRIIRTGTINVVECHRAPEFAFQQFRCIGEVTYAPESTWNRDVEKLRQEKPGFYSKQPVTGTVEFFTFDSRGTNYPAWSKQTIAEIAFPTKDRVPFAPTQLAVPGGVAVGGFVGGILLAGIAGKAIGLAPPRKD